MTTPVHIVTGGGGAIGRAVVDAFAGHGARVVAADLHATELSPAAMDAQGFALACDLTSAQGAERLVATVLDRCGRIDGLVHTVGGFAMGRVHEVDAAQYDRMFDLNVRSLFFAARAVLPHFLARGDGFLAAFSSINGWTGTGAGKALYAAAKSAVATFLHAVDEEAAGALRVAVVYPMGSVDTPANRRDMPDVDPATWIDPREIAETLWHASTRTSRGRLLDLPIHPPRT